MQNLLQNIYLLSAIYLITLNLITFIFYGWDKYQATKGNQRISEKTLLLFGLFGGWIGAIVAQKLFRHKTVKQPFRSWFFFTIFLNLLTIAVITYLLIRY